MKTLTDRKLVGFGSGVLPWILGIISFLLIVFLIHRGYPQPFYDDLAVVGGGLSLAKGQGFQNPHVREWMSAFPADRPFFYPPGMSYLLAGWLGIFGIGVTSMVAFQWTALLAGAASMGWLLHRWLRQPAAVCVVAGLAFILAFQLEGFRNEVSAFALAFCGLCLCFYRNYGLKLAGYFLIVFSGVVYPLVPIMVLPVYISIFWLVRPKEFLNRTELARDLAKECMFALPGLLVGTLAFLWMIDWNPAEFFRVIKIHKQVAVPGGLIAQLDGFKTIITGDSQIFIRLPITILALVAMLYSIFASLRSKSWDWMIPAGVTLCYILCILGNPMRAKYFAPILQIAVIMIVLVKITDVKRWFPPLVGLLFVGLVNSKTLLSLLLQSPVNMNQVALVRNRLSDVDYDKTRVYICPWAARYVYEYNIPDQITDITTWKSVPKVIHMKPPRVAVFPRESPDEIWISRSEDFYLDGRGIGPDPFPMPERARFRGKVFHNIPARQAEIVVR